MIILTQVDDVSASLVNDDLSGIVVARLLVLDDDLMLAWLNIAGKYVDIINTLLLSHLFLVIGEHFPIGELLRQACLWKVGNQDVLLGEWEIVLESLMPVLVVKNTNLRCELVLDTLRE